MSSETAAHVNLEAQALVEQTKAGEWSPEVFGAFWANPDVDSVRTYIPGFVTPDITGYWPGAVVHGPEAYTEALVDFISMLPDDVGLEVGDHARTDEVAFVRWVMRGTGRKGPFTLHGIDRLRFRDNLVCENFITFDSAHLNAQLAYNPPS